MPYLATRIAWRYRFLRWRPALTRTAVALQATLSAADQQTVPGARTLYLRSTRPRSPIPDSRPNWLSSSNRATRPPSSTWSRTCASSNSASLKDA